MVRGLYTSGWGMMALNRKMDVVANNMANVDTNGYKKDTVVYEGFDQMLTKRINDYHYSGDTIGTMVLASDVGEVFTDFSQGQLARTERKLDISLKNGREGRTAFFVVEVDDGNSGYSRYYTRDGSFSISSDNLLVTGEGNTVMGENGPIRLYGDTFSVIEDGTVIQDDMIAGRLMIREFGDTTVMRKAGTNLLRSEDGAGALRFTGSVKQGFIERSNVNIVREMTDMITVMRAYETNQKMVQTHDRMLEKAVNEVGAVR